MKDAVSAPWPRFARALTDPAQQIREGGEAGRPPY